MESAQFLEQIKIRYGLRSDYALAECLGITQPEANLIRRGRKTPNPELCMRMADLLGINPVELLLVAQKDKAPSQVKPYWDMALTAVDVMLHVPKRPRYLPQKVKDIGQELRQLANQTLCYEGAMAHSEAVRLMETTQRSVDSVMERWNLWRRGEPLYPNYLLVNQGAVSRDVSVQRLLIFPKRDLKSKKSLNDCIQVMQDQKRAGVAVFYAFRDELARSVTFQRLVDSYKEYGGVKEINAALFDGEMLIFSRDYKKIPLRGNGAGSSVTRLNQLQMTWKSEHLRDMSPLPLFEMTQYVVPFKNERMFRTHVAQGKLPSIRQNSLRPNGNLTKR